MNGDMAAAAAKRRMPVTDCRVLSTDHDEGPGWCQGPTEAPDRLVADEVDDHVVAAGVGRDVVGGVVDDVVGADRPDEVGVASTGHPGHFGSVHLRDLYGEGADAS